MTEPARFPIDNVRSSEALVRAVRLRYRSGVPKRSDLRRILIIGSGPIVIGQACEFDYSGTQGAKALVEEGYEVILVNSNPATIMTDPEIAYRTYVEPLDPKTLRAILERERPNAVLPTLGGQTALNLALELHRNGTLRDLNIELLGAKPASIEMAEDRALFKDAMARIGLSCPRSSLARSLDEAWAFVRQTGFPAILRPSFTLGGSGGGIVESEAEFEAKIAWALDQSPTHEVLVEESVLGWKEYELEVIRDRKGNFIVICSIENIDPMGIHTGDSVTVAPQMTLTDKEYQRLRDAAAAVMQEIGVETGGANVQFAVNPKDGRVFVIEMNPRVSRSSALASKATGYPIAKIAAKLAVGYTLDELTNDITKTSAAFEPVIDYVVVKWPRFAFEKFPGADTSLGPQMKSVGEVMSLGRTFLEAIQKAARSLETGRDGLVSLAHEVDVRRLSEKVATRDMTMEAPAPLPPSKRNASTDSEVLGAVRSLMARPGPDRLFFVVDALRLGVPGAEISERTGIDPWFISQFDKLVAFENALSTHQGGGLDATRLRQAKRLGFSDRQVARLTSLGQDEVAALRARFQIAPTFARVDTCAAEFVAHTPYLYSTFETKNEAAPTDRKKVVILGGGPNRIGQGIEFDYCCVHAVKALREEGFETIMVNCNPETVSTDYDTADRLYFEPLSLESVLAICEEEKPFGVMVQFGGQTPLRLALALEKAGVRLLGTSADAIDRAEDRSRFDTLLNKLGLLRPKSAVAKTREDAFARAREIGFPVLLRPSYVLGGRAMCIAYTEEEMAAYVDEVIQVAAGSGNPHILIDEFLRHAIEVDVDCVSDGEDVVIGAVMQHIEEAGVHSGDSSSVLPPHSLSIERVAAIEEETRLLARELGVVGLMNVQFAVQEGRVYVLEVNPRASRTVPFVAKATGFPLAKVAARLMVGRTLADLGIRALPRLQHTAVKTSVFPFAKFPGVDTILGPEMRSTGEVMGIARTFAEAMQKSLLASGQAALSPVPNDGRKAFLSVKNADKSVACVIARHLQSLGFSLCATKGTAEALRQARIATDEINKVGQGSPHIVDAIRAGSISLVVNTAAGAKEVRDSYSIRRSALLARVPYFTTVSAALAACDALAVAMRGAPIEVRSLQEWTGVVRS